MISARGYVVDASVVAKWFAAEALSEAAASLRRVPLHAPELLIPECANILWKKARRSEMTPEQIAEAVDLLQQADIGLHSSRSLLDKIVELTRALDHPAYDCTYLATAWLLELPLVTADTRLAHIGGGADIDRAKLPAILSLATFAL